MYRAPAGSSSLSCDITFGLAAPETSSWAILDYAVSGGGAQGLPCCCSFSSLSARASYSDNATTDAVMALPDPYQMLHDEMMKGSGCLTRLQTEPLLPPSMRLNKLQHNTITRDFNSRFLCPSCSRVSVPKSIQLPNKSQRVNRASGGSPKFMHRSFLVA